MDCLWDLLVLVSLAGLVIFAVYGVCNTANERISGLFFCDAENVCGDGSMSVCHLCPDK